MMMTVEAPARTKWRAMALPMPAPPPVMRTVLPDWLRRGFVGDIAGYGALWTVVVKFVDTLFWRSKSAIVMVLSLRIGIEVVQGLDMEILY